MAATAERAAPREFAAALQAWRDVRLVALQGRLTEQAPLVEGVQRDALLSRKALADRTRGGVRPFRSDVIPTAFPAL